MDEGLCGFPGGREYFEESPQEAAERILADEVPGINANMRRMVTALYDKGYDQRAYNVTIYFLFDYIDGDPEPSHQWEAFNWMNKKEIINSEYMHPIEKQILVNLDHEIRLINSNQDEILVEVDEEDNEIGKIVRRIAHMDGRRYHRAAHIVIFNTSGEVVLHKRSLNKDTAPGKWDIFGGHQLHGQSIKQTSINELFEELGVKTNLNFHSKSLYQSKTQSEFGYLYWGIHDGPYSWDPNEIEEVEAFSIRKILDDRYKNYEFNPLVNNSLEKLRSIWQEF